MKIMLMSAFILISSAVQPVFAQVRVKPSIIQALNYNGKTLSGYYMTGGGCQVHTAELELKFIDQKYENYYGKKVYKVEVSIVDTTPVRDGCEAGIDVEYKFNFKKENAKQLKAQGLDESAIEISGIILPEVSY